MAFKPRFIYSNQAEGMTASATDEATGFPAEAAFDMDRTSYWKAGSDSYTNEWLKVDLGSAKTISGLGLANHNIGTLTGTQKLQASTDDFSASTVDIKTIAPAATGDYYATFTGVSYRYWRLLLNSAAGQTPYVGEFYLGTTLQISENPDSGFEEEDSWQTLMTQSIAGHQVIKETGRYTRLFRAKWDPVAVALRDNWRTILLAQSGNLKPFFYIPRADSTSPTEGAAYFVRLAGNRFVARELLTDVWAVTVELEEQQ